MEFLKCKHCNKEKAVSEFYKYRMNKCKECTQSYNRTLYVKHKEKRVAYDKARGSGWERSDRAKYESSKEVKWGTHLKRKYGINESEFYALWEAQGRVCSICKKECNRSSSSKLHVDHCHKTGRVRGLLCFKCNTGIGRFDDNIELLQNAIKYLKGEI